jgi:hypothetical protein
MQPGRKLAGALSPEHDLEAEDQISCGHQGWNGGFDRGNGDGIGARENVAVDQALRVQSRCSLPADRFPAWDDGPVEFASELASTVRRAIRTQPNRESRSGAERETSVAD